MAQKRHLDIKDGVEVYKKSKAYVDEKVRIESDAAIDTLFDTYYDPVEQCIVFGAGCASFDATTGTLEIAGTFEDDTIVIS